MHLKFPAAFPALLLALLAITAVTGAPTAQAAALPAAASVTAASTAAASVKVIDSANIITDPAWFVKAYDAGFRLYVMHSTEWGTCAPWSRTQPQLKMALDAGLKVAVYTRDASCWQGGIEATGPYRSQLEFFALDVETDSPPVTRAMVDGVRGAGVRPVIYSGSGMWPSIMNDSPDFADVPLWDASAGATDYATWTADHLAPAPVPYGGWNTGATMRIGVQQKFEQNLNGVNVDLNSFAASFLDAATPAPASAPAPAPHPVAPPRGGFESGLGGWSPAEAGGEIQTQQQFERLYARHGADGGRPGRGAVIVRLAGAAE
jgi:hypothetical protein